MFKIGSEIVCIVPGKVEEGSTLVKSLGLTLYKKYEVIGCPDHFYINSSSLMVHIRNDRNESQSYSTFRFVTLLGYRKLKLEKLNRLSQQTKE